MVSQSRLYFDAKDYELLTMVNRFLSRDPGAPHDDDTIFFHDALHPHGIKELTMSREIRVAYSVINLLDTLDTGQVQDRINALRALHREVLTAPSSSFRHNTGRVLLQIMKSLVRAHGNPAEQLRLANDFRKASTGNRRVVRRMLRRYYLLEMPEAWNQVAFDNHVHDANTKGRKSPTQLIMDAWIKGLRKLDVMYYNFVEETALSELLQAADIMGIKVRVGVEFQARFRERFVQFTWQPRGFTDWRDMLSFFQEKPTQHLMRMGREASLYYHDYVMELLSRYNEKLRYELGLELGLRLPEISQDEILSFVGIGQTSRTHLSELIYRRVMAAFDESCDLRRQRWEKGDSEERAAIDAQIAKINALSPEQITAEWLGKARNPDVPIATDPDVQDKIPEIMRLLPMTLIDWLVSIRSPCHITLNLCKLTVEDVLELLYSCEGMISHLEMFNLKNYSDGKMQDIEAISNLQYAINEGSAIALKRLIRNLMQEAGCFGENGNCALGSEGEAGYGHAAYSQSGSSCATQGSNRCELFREILRNIPKLQAYYAKRPLGTRIGSDSTGRSSKKYGMGFAFLETLPARARKEVSRADSLRKPIPFTQQACRQITYFPKRQQTLGQGLTGLIRKIPGFATFGTLRQVDWRMDEKTVHYDAQAQTIATLGGFHQDGKNGFASKGAPARAGKRGGIAYMNTALKNTLKVLLGFALTFVTFQYTQTWWVLAWFGPFIWFGITGGRNIVQAMLAGGGLHRTPLLRWNDYLSWTRLCDSLLFTGISVPLLELGVRNLLLEDTIGITSVSGPVLFYTIMSLVNGIYIASHNIFRGLPQEAVIGNIFRSFLAIPVSVFYNFLALKLFTALGLPVFYLAEGGAVISKLASDTIATLIEAPADRAEHLRQRHWDYVGKFAQLFDCISRLELLLPEEDISSLLCRPKEFIRTVGREAKEMEKTIIVNALDLMYFWMYQPQARNTLKKQLASMTLEERAIFAHSQIVLTRVQEVSQMLVDGLVGLQFARALSFYLSRHEEYLTDMAELTGVDVAASLRP